MFELTITFTDGEIIQHSLAQVHDWVWKDRILYVTTRHDGHAVQYTYPAYVVKCTGSQWIS